MMLLRPKKRPPKRRTPAAGTAGANSREGKSKASRSNSVFTYHIGPTLSMRWQVDPNLTVVTFTLIERKAQ